MKKQIQIIFDESRLSETGISSQEAYLALTEFLQPYSFKRFKGSKYSSTEDISDEDMRAMLYHLAADFPYAECIEIIKYTDIYDCNNNH